MFIYVPTVHITLVKQFKKIKIITIYIAEENNKRIATGLITFPMIGDTKCGISDL
jgi:hypothetical protein